MFFIFYNKKYMTDQSKNVSSNYENDRKLKSQLGYAV